MNNQHKAETDTKLTDLNFLQSRMTKKFRQEWNRSEKVSKLQFPGFYSTKTRTLTKDEGGIDEFKWWEMVVVGKL